jgi:hypothetical protein
MLGSEHLLGGCQGMLQERLRFGIKALSFVQGPAS